jgi:hypothetical protein
MMDDQMIRRTKEDKAYEAARDRLIPTAEEYANKLVGPRPADNSESTGATWFWKWNRAFHGRMNELARGAGLTG